MNLKNGMILLISILLTSCAAHNYKGMEITGKGKKCFKREDIAALVKARFEPGEELSTYLAIRPAITDSINCIGLYNCVFHDLSSNQVIYKVLKFENTVYTFSSENTDINEEQLNEFIAKYKKSFSEKDLETLIIQFRKGTEYHGSFF